MRQLLKTDVSVFRRLLDWTAEMTTHTNIPTTAAAIADGVRSGALKAVDVLEAHLAQIAAREGDIHAFNLVTADEARAAAARVDADVAAGRDPGVLAGVPIALKDNMCTRGIPTTCSSKILEGWRPPYDATVVQRLAAAGAVAIGKTNLDEFAMGSSTENSAFGVTFNPRDVSRVSGGSSGGSAAAVAAGFSPISIGSDTGGSIRQPAALCGVVGVKPTYGTVSRYGLVAYASSLDQIGPFSTTVADSALLLETIAGYDGRDSTSINAVSPSLIESLGEGVDGLRIGFVTELMGEGIAPDVAARVRQAADALAAAGAQIGEVSVPAAAYGLSAYYLIAPAEASSNLARYDGVRYGMRVDAPTTAEMNAATRTAGFGDEVKRRIMIGSYVLSHGYYDAYYLQAQKIRRMIANDFQAAFAQCDVIAGPVAPTTAWKLGDKADDPVANYLADIFTLPASLAGLPCMSIPVGLGDMGMPVGMQLIGNYLQEASLLNVAHRFQSAHPEFHTAKPEGV